MSETTNELREIEMRIHRSGQAASFLLTAGVQTILQLIQFLMRLEKENILKGGEVAEFADFMKATEGNFDMVNVPYTEYHFGRSLMDVKADMDSIGIRYHILPDLNSADQCFQVCVYRPDRQKFDLFFSNYLKTMLSGGEWKKKDLTAVTGGNATVISIPLEGNEKKVKQDLTKLNVNFAMMPDLHVGDGQVQLLVANRDEPKLEQWYQLYRQDHMHQTGEQLPEIQKMDMNTYAQTADTDSEAYIRSAEGVAKAANEKYEGKEKGETEKLIGEVDRSVSTADSVKFEGCLNDNRYVMLSIDKATLVDDEDAVRAMMDDPRGFACRLPGTYGENKKVLLIPKGQVFEVQDADRPRYIAFVDKTLKPIVVSASDGKIDWKFCKTGQELLKHFDKVDEQVRSDRMKQLQDISKEVVSSVPIPNPVKAK